MRTVYDMVVVELANLAKWMAAANDTLALVKFFESTNTSYEVNAGGSKKDKGLGPDAGKGQSSSADRGENEV